MALKSVVSHCPSLTQKWQYDVFHWRASHHSTSHLHSPSQAFPPCQSSASVSRKRNLLRHSMSGSLGRFKEKENERPLGGRRASRKGVVSCEAREGSAEVEESEGGGGSVGPALPGNEWLQFTEGMSPRASQAARGQEWETEKLAKEAEEMARQGISIRRRPPLGTPRHSVGTFEFRIESELKSENEPRNILEEIIWHKDTEVTQMKEKMPLPTLLKGLPSVAPPLDFIQALRTRASETGLPALIAEVKKASPSRGVIQPNFDPVLIGQAYEKGGAACLSVLTDSKYFQGSFENLKLIRAGGVRLPLLCKEFVIDAWQLYFARLKGADAILLIAAVLPDQDLRYLTKIARNLGLQCLIEVHTPVEMDRVLALEGVELIGINNRDLGTFKVDIGNTAELLKGERGAEIKKRGILVVGESGLFTPEDVAFVQNAGVGAVLVGESLVKQDDPCAGIAGLFGKDISKQVLGV
eukprot:TRINITY_DN4707_c0_g1_i1.p1 TRINITY_DN4707_c0_g1~~TRINITY_DN4707_c0_g1_i1.p1  ORF type:complete len:468 (+),score=86.69 TRINITY_DN4707_c0_g1_i1:125-1528(+)